MSKELTSQTPATSTPSSHWRAEGAPDPHAGHYDGERAALAMGKLTDDELANGAFMNYDQPLNLAGIIAGTHSSPIAWMTAVKDRIRWLSRSLERVAAERDALAAELKALREQEPVAWGDEPWMASFGVRVGRDSSNSIDLIFTTVGQRKFQLYAHEAAYLRGLLNKAEIPGYPNTHPVPARELTDAIIGQIYIKAAAHIEHATQREIAFARAIERHLRGDAP